MTRSRALIRTATVAFAALALLLTTVSAATSDGHLLPVGPATVEGPIPATAPEEGGDPAASSVEGTYPWFSTWVDLEDAGYVEEEFYVSGTANAFHPVTGDLVAQDIPYRTRVLVRRPADPKDFNGTVLAEWQNVTAGYDLDALWAPTDMLRDGYAWVGISAQAVNGAGGGGGITGVDHLKAWSPARYGSLDVTGGGVFTSNELAFDVFAQAANALVDGEGDDPLGGLDAQRILAIGASQSAGFLTTYYEQVLPQSAPVFDGYAFVVGRAPEAVRDEPVFQIVSETDVWIGLAGPDRPDTDTFRRWEVAGAAHSGWNGQEYRRPLQERDLGDAPTYECAAPAFSRVPLHHVLATAYDHLAVWVDDGTPPPSAPRIERDGGVIVRDELGLAQGGIQLSQVAVPTAVNTGVNGGASFCVLFGTHLPLDSDTLSALYPNHGRYVSAVRHVDKDNVRAGYLEHEDAGQNLREAAHSDIGR